MKTEAEFLEALIEVIESEKPSVEILNIVEGRVSGRLYRLLNDAEENRRVEGHDA